MWLALGPRSGLIQWVGGAIPLFSVYRGQARRLFADLAWPLIPSGHRTEVTVGEPGLRQ